MKFGTLRKYLSHIDRLSICMLETLEYQNYIFLKQVPDVYDDLYVHGVGMIESEFYKVEEYLYATIGAKEQLVFLPCIEIMLSHAPRKD